MGHMIATNQGKCTGNREALGQLLPDVCVLDRTSPFMCLPTRSSWINMLCVKSVETVQCGSILPKQHCSLTDPAGENNNSEMAAETVRVRLGEVREGP